jgi:hypothetical protein
MVHGECLMFKRYFSTPYEKPFFIHKNTLFDVVTRSGTASLAVVKEKHIINEETKVAKWLREAWRHSPSRVNFVITRWLLVSFM